MEFLGLDERLVLAIASGLYMTAVAFALMHLLKGRRYVRFVLLGLVSTGFVIQTLGLYLRGLERGSCPLSNSFEFIQFIAWSTILLYLMVGPAFRVSLLGFFSASLAALLTFVSLLVQRWDSEVVASESPVQPWIEAHASFALFSYGAFGLLFLTASMYLLQVHGLQNKRLESLFRFLPSIVAIDRMNLRLLIIGIVSLTLSLGLAFFYGWNAFEGVSWSKLGGTFLVWLVSVALLVLRLVRLLLTKKFSWGCIALFGTALFSLAFV